MKYLPELTQALLLPEIGRYTPECRYPDSGMARRAYEMARYELGYVDLTPAQTTDVALSLSLDGAAVEELP